MERENQHNSAPGGAQDREETWLAGEFARSELPRGDLALYLNVDKAAVSRALRGRRVLSEEERRLAEAFFSVVPPEADDDYRRAVRRLRAPAIRARAAGALARWLARYPRSTGEIESMVQRGPGMRADQIVAVARAEGLDLPALVTRGEARTAADAAAPAPSDTRDPAARLAEAARVWARGPQAVYALSAGTGRASSPPAPAARPHTALRPLGRSRSSEPWHGYALTDDSLLPRFERGDTLMLEPLSMRDGEFPVGSDGVRRHDLVAVVIEADTSARGAAPSAGEPETLRAIVGRATVLGRRSLTLQPARGPPSTSPPPRWPRCTG